MKNKKNSRYGLQRDYLLRYQIGLLVALSLCFTAFEWKTYNYSLKTLSGTVGEDPDPVQILQPVKIEKKEKVETVQKPVAPNHTEPIVIVDDNHVVIADSSDIVISPEPLITPVYVAPEPIPEPDPLIVSEYMPEFPGGYEKLRKYISSKLKYPEDSRKQGITGTVFLSFVVDEEGFVGSVKVLKGVNNEMDAEALRVLQSLPQWKPGMQNGHKVSVLQSIDIRYKLK